MEKPFKGEIHNWRKVYFDREKAEEVYQESAGLGYCIAGHTKGHPEFDGAPWFRTSWVMSQDQDGNVETRNNRYLLVGPERT